jgi:hypothetical protein
MKQGVKEPRSFLKKSAIVRSARQNEARGPGIESASTILYYSIIYDV